MLRYSFNFIKTLLQDALNLIEDLTLNQQVILSGVVTGVAAGLASLALIEMIFFFQGASLDRAKHWPFLWRSTALVFFPALGVGGGAALIHFFCPAAKGHGTNEVYEAITKNDGRIPGMVAWIKLLASALTLGLGGSTGTEGPIIHSGGAVGSWIGQKLKVPTSNLKTLVAAGAASGLAVSLGTPLTAVFFTMEVLLKDFANESFVAVVIASVAGVAVVSAFSPTQNFYPVMSWTWTKPSDFVIYALLGLSCAPFGVLYMRAVHWTEEQAKKFAKIPDWTLPWIGGALVGAIGLGLPEVLGPGKDVIAALLSGHYLNWKAGALTLAKIAATSATLGFGGCGGAFVPAMFIGTAAGNAWAALFHPWISDPSLIASFPLIGMACVVTSSFRAPFTAMILALEISKDYGVLLPVMLACVIAHAATRSSKITPVIEQ
ncbi:MAG: chloride channel protein [Elusimicrobiota bacterium]